MHALPQQPLIADLHAGLSPGGWWSLHIHGDWERLSEMLGPVAVVAERAHRWFFIHYADTGPHLRVRLQGEDNDLKPLVDEIVAIAGHHGAASVVGLVYQRELERYGGAAAITAAERVFHRSARLAHRLLAENHGRRGRLFGYGAMLAVAAFETAGFASVTAAQHYANGIKQVVDQLSLRHGLPPLEQLPQPSRLPVEDWLQWGQRLAGAGATGVPAEIGRYLDALADHRDLLAQAGASPTELESITGSHLHMTCNRLGLSVFDELWMMQALAAHNSELCQ